MSIQTLVGIIFLLAVIIAGLGVVIWNQRLEINKLKRPHYGFLGKPLMSVLAVVAVTGSILLVTGNGQQSGGSISVGDEYEISLDIEVIELDVLGDEPAPQGVLLQLVPTLAGERWGAGGVKLTNVVWQLTSIYDEDYIWSFTEEEVSQDEPGGWTIALPDGVYTVESTAYYAGVPWLATTELEVGND